MRKYDSTNPLLQWANQLPVDVRAPIAKSVRDDGKLITLVMSSADYTDKQITEAVTAYNMEYPEHMSYSFQLPATMYGFPANSWVLVLPEREQ
ncbi:hypothetical protein [Pseudomonas sp. PLMAX]|uniref:hypothetical protein n=1 Tax=Pseudomonas sp. PLMAX TaxID=2201998 RepID=UPI0038BD4B9B